VHFDGCMNRFHSHFLRNAMQKQGVYFGSASAFLLHYRPTMQQNFHRDQPPTRTTSNPFARGQRQRHYETSGANYNCQSHWLTRSTSFIAASRRLSKATIIGATSWVKSLRKPQLECMSILFPFLLPYSPFPVKWHRSRNS